MPVKSTFPDVVIPEVSVADHIFERILQYGNDIALVDNGNGKSITYEELYHQSRSLAVGLQKVGLNKGDVVGISISSKIEFPVIVLAVMKCGAMTSTIDPSYTEGEILQQFNITQPRFAFADCEVAATLTKLRLPFLEEIFPIGQMENYTSYHQLIEGNENESPKSVDIDPKMDIASLLCSSGTTGLPKSVIITHYNWMASLTSWGIQFKMYRSSCCYMERPLYHAYGYYILLLCLQAGAKVVLEEKFDVETALKAIEHYKVTDFPAVPNIVMKLSKCDLQNKYDTSSLKRIFWGGSPLPPAIISAFETRYKATVSGAYGLSECTPVSMSDPLINPAGSVGPIISGTMIKVCDINTGKELGCGEDGEIRIKGPQVAKGYYRNPEATANAFDTDGWLHTGDFGHYDKSGMLYVVDRLKGGIKYRLYLTIAPPELEAVLFGHPKIEDAAVVGIPHKEDGEVPKAFVVRKDDSLTEEEVKKLIAERLSDYKQLRGGVEFLEAIPKTATGKVNRAKLLHSPLLWVASLINYSLSVWATLL